MATPGGELVSPWFVAAWPGMGQVALTAASLASGLLAVTVERLAYRPVRRAGRIAALLTAVGVSLLLQNLAIRVWSADTRAWPDPRVWIDVASLDGPIQSHPASSPSASTVKRKCPPTRRPPGKNCSSESFRAWAACSGVSPARMRAAS